MCRLFGFRSNVLSNAHHSLMEAENAVARQAELHKDGWGIGYYLEEEPYLFRAAKGAAEDHRFQKMSQRLRSQTFVVHVRRATVGDVDSFNSHPFRFGKWLFAHNGTIFDFDRIRPQIMQDIDERFHPLIFGSTDSERYFYFILSHLIQNGIPKDGRGEIDIERAAEAQQTALSKIFKWVKEEGLEPPKANYILTNGTVMFGRRAGLELFLATQKINCAEAETCPEADKICLAGILPPLKIAARRPRKCNHLIMASEPIGNQDIWEEIPDGSLVSLDENYKLRLHEAPNPFWVTWPPEVSRPPKRENVIAVK
jgi:predicted glutamine amidotransferase